MKTTYGLLVLVVIVGFTTQANAQWVTSGSNVYNLGNVGVGITNPLTELHIEGTAPVLRFKATNLGSGVRFDVRDQTGDLFRFQKDGTTQMVIRNNGNVGIGVTSTSYKLEVNGTSKLSNTLTIERNSTLSHIKFEGSTAAPFAEWRMGLVNDGGGTHSGFGIRDAQAPNNPTPFWIRAASPGNSMVVTPDGVGLGTTNPQSRLSIKQFSDDLSGGIELESTGSEAAFIYRESDSEDALILRNNGINTVGVEHGRVGIGTTNPLRELDVNGDIELSGSIYGKNTDLTYYKIANGGNYNHEFYTRTNTGSSRERFRIEGGAVVDDVLILNSNFNVNSGQLYTQQSSGNVGIGTASPEAKFHIEGSNEGVKSQYGFSVIEHIDAQLDIVSSSDGTWGSTINFVEGNGASNTDVWSITRQTTNGAGNSSLRFNFGTINNHTNANKVTFQSDGKVGIGTSNPDSKLTVKGDIHAEEVIVDLLVPGPDYVFEEDYDLTSLKELEAYIKANKHLPEIPSAKEMEEKGIDLGVMNMLLLKKIEELTLHTIAQDKAIEVEREKNASANKVQQALIEELMKRLEKLEAEKK